MGKEQSHRALETLDINCYVWCSGPHLSLQKCLGKAWSECHSDASTDGRVTAGNILPTLSSHKATDSARKWGWRARSGGHLACLPLRPARVTQELGKTLIPGYHGVKMEQVFDGSPYSKKRAMRPVLGCSVVK